ncbi:MAG: hypothetical protein ACP5UZ_09135 [Thermoplasmata archaeon]
MPGKSNRTKEEKARIVMEALSDSTPIAEICRRYNVTLICSWHFETF